MSDHYYSEKPGSRLEYTDIQYSIDGATVKLRTGSGVFSIGRVDKGTEILLKYMKIEDSWDVLDLGCGYGVVGVVIAKRYPGCTVVMTDVNKRAVKLSKQNIKLNHIDNASVVQGFSYDKIEGKFDTILLNPPQSAGKQLCLDMITDAKKYLKQGGYLQIVARKNKGGAALSQHMEEVFGNLDVLAKKSGFWVYVSKL